MRKDEACWYIMGHYLGALWALFAPALRAGMVVWFHAQRMLHRATKGTKQRSKSEEFLHDIFVIGLLLCLSALSDICSIVFVAGDSAAEGFGDYIVAGLDAGFFHHLLKAVRKILNIATLGKGCLHGLADCCN